MSDRYLFKAKRKDWKKLPKNKWWVEGNLIKNLDGRCFIVIPVEDSKLEYCLECGVVYDTDYQFEVIPDAVCQYTGLNDKNDKKIFENDITKLVLPDGEVRYFKVSFKKVIRKVICHPDFDDDVAKVELNSICFEWNGYELFPCINENRVSDVSKMEVIGNIFDNPELLESMIGKYRKRRGFMTNADRIRNMTNDELADFLFKVNCAYAEPCMTGEKTCKWEDYPTHDKGCKDCFIEWLGKERDVN